MTGMCGWTGYHTSVACDEELLGRMISHLGNGRGVKTVRHCSALGSISEIAEVRGLTASIEGSPVWDDQVLRKVARRAGDAHALAVGFLEKGRGVLSGLRGHFSLAVLNDSEGEALLAIDRMGVRSLSYACVGESVVFGTSVDSVQRHPLIESVLDAQSLFDYTLFGFVPSPRTIYRGQRKLLPGQFLHFRDGTISCEYYWTPVFEDQTSHSLEELAEELQATLGDAVRRTISERPTGAFLSGGLDSSTVAGLLSQNLDYPVKTFSIGFNADGYDEMAFARATANAFGLLPHEYYVSEQDVLDTIPIIARSFDEPFGNASAVPTYHCARIAKESGIEVLLAGDGGDELFAGNSRYAKQCAFEKYGLIPQSLRERVVEPLLFGFPGWRTIPPIRKMQSYVRQANVPLPERLYVREFNRRTQPEDIFHGDLAVDMDSAYPFAIWEQSFSRPDTDSVVNRMLFLDWKHALADSDLRKVNRMCETVGIDVRYPMLDDLVVDLSMRIPAKIKIRGRRLRYFYKKAFEEFLPRVTLGKGKHGFGLPYGVWLRTSTELQSLTYDALHCLKNRDLFRHDRIDWLVKQHREKHAVFYGPNLWQLMILELWLQEHTV